MDAALLSDTCQSMINYQIQKRLSRDWSGLLRANSRLFVYLRFLRFGTIFADSQWLLSSYQIRLGISNIYTFVNTCFFLLFIFL